MEIYRILWKLLWKVRETKLEDLIATTWSEWCTVWFSRIFLLMSKHWWMPGAGSGENRVGIHWNSFFREATDQRASGLCELLITRDWYAVWANTELHGVEWRLWGIRVKMYLRAFLGYRFSKPFQKHFAWTYDFGVISLFWISHN